MQKFIIFECSGRNFNPLIVKCGMKCLPYKFNYSLHAKNKFFSLIFDRYYAKILILCYSLYKQSNIFKDGIKTSFHCIILTFIICKIYLIHIQP